MFGSIVVASANAFGVESKPAPMDVGSMLMVFGVVIGVIAVASIASVVYSLKSKSRTK